MSAVHRANFIVEYVCCAHACVCMQKHVVECVRSHRLQDSPAIVALHGQWYTYIYCFQLCFKTCSRILLNSIKILTKAITGTYVCIILPHTYMFDSHSSLKQKNMDLQTARPPSRDLEWPF